MYKNKFTIFSCLIAASLSSCTAMKSPSINNAYKKEGYTLVWSDEFNKPGALDSNNWRFEKGFVRNREDQWYQEQNAWCKDGILVLEARRESKPNPDHQPDSEHWGRSREAIAYTSSSVHTSGKHSWKYGRFEMRGRIDIQSGLWPAWWTLGITKKWPANGEIDMMEFYRKKLLANVACLGPDGKPEWFIKTFSTDSLGGQVWSSGFHIWRMDWDQTMIELYIDNQLLNRVETAEVVNKDGTGFNPFHQQHYMLLSLALGGTNGGDLNGTSFPRRFEVDYVRVYQKKE
jgi:beta-glucanase (GH16 family)